MVHHGCVGQRLFERGQIELQLHDPLAAPSGEWNDVMQHRERIERWLAGNAQTRPLRLTKVHTLLVRDHGLRASYDTLWRFATQQLGWRKKTETVRVDDPPPGQEAQVDFGEMGRLVDNETGKRRVLWALIVTLSFRRLQFVWPTFRQTTEPSAKRSTARGGSSAPCRSQSSRTTPRR